MSKINKGGPAFPVDVPGHRIEMGMTLRDYFAAKALQGMLADSKRSGTLEAFAHDAYKAADAMLRAREAT